MYRLECAGARATVDTQRGGRVSSLQVDGTEVVVGPTMPDGSARDQFGWGIYPMVPFAGRVRNGTFVFDGRQVRLPVRMAPHAIHGTVDDVEWRVVSESESAIEMECDLGPSWPFAGTARHVITLADGSVTFVLSLTAHETMPAQVGWHPWFRRPAQVHADFGGWLPRDAGGMPTGPTAIGIPSLSGPVDDCFVSPSGSVSVESNGVNLELRSDCSHWVVYTCDAHGVCVEPQSGPPNEFESAPVVLLAGGTLRRSLAISWASR